nr:zinc finger, CCHC-type [Tanacetum cinerariifolium]
MVAASMKHMASNFAKLDKFKRVDFKRWQKKMHSLLSSMSVMYVLTTPMPEDGGDNPIVEQVRKRAKWDNDDYVYRADKPKDNTLTSSVPGQDEASRVTLLLNTSILTWAVAKNGRPRIKGTYSSSAISWMAILASAAILEVDEIQLDDKLHMIEEPVKVVDREVKRLKQSRIPIVKVCWNSQRGPEFTWGREDRIKKKYPHLFTTAQSNVRWVGCYNMSKDGLIPDFDMDTEKWNKKYFVTFIDDASKFCYIYLLHTKDEALDKFKVFKTKVELQQRSLIKRFKTDRGDSVSVNSITESMDAIFYENRFSSVPRPSQRFLVKGTEDLGGLVVPEEVTDEVVQQHDPELRKNKMHMTLKDFGPEFQLYLIERTRDEKDSTNDDMDSIMGNNTLVLDDLSPVQVDLTKEFLLSRFSMKDMGEADVILGIRIKHEINGIAISQSRYIKKVLKKFNYFECTLVSTHMDTSEKLMPNNGQLASQLKYSRVIGYLMYAMTYTRPDIAFAMGKLSRYTSNPGTQHWQVIQRVLKCLKKTMDYSLTYIGYPSLLEGYTNASWINNTKNNLSTSGWVFLLSGGVISWAFKKQTCITGSTIESEFVAIAAAGKEAEWLKNLLFEILLWSKPISPISIRYDNAATLAKAYSQMYNGKSRHLGVSHSMIHELIMNGVVSIEFVRSQQNLANHLTNGLARDLVIKSAEG